MSSHPQVALKFVPKAVMSESVALSEQLVRFRGTYYQIEILLAYRCQNGRPIGARLNKSLESFAPFELAAARAHAVVQEVISIAERELPLNRGKGLVALTLQGIFLEGSGIEPFNSDEQKRAKCILSFIRILQAVDRALHQSENSRPKKDFLSLPAEILFHLFSFLTFKEWGTCSKVCKDLRGVALNPQLLKPRIKRDYPHLLESFCEIDSIQILKEKTQDLLIRKNMAEGRYLGKEASQKGDQLIVWAVYNDQLIFSIDEKLRIIDSQNLKLGDFPSLKGKLLKVLVKDDLLFCCTVKGAVAIYDLKGMFEDSDRKRFKCLTKMKIAEDVVDFQVTKNWLFVRSQSQLFSAWECEEGKGTYTLKYTVHWREMRRSSTQSLAASDNKIFLIHENSDRDKGILAWDIDKLHGSCIPIIIPQIARHEHIRSILYDHGRLFAGTSEGKVWIWKFDPLSNAFNVVDSFVAYEESLTPSIESLSASGNKLYCLRQDGFEIWHLQDSKFARLNKTSFYSHGLSDGLSETTTTSLVAHEDKVFLGLKCLEYDSGFVEETDEEGDNFDDERSFERTFESFSLKPRKNLKIVSYDYTYLDDQLDLAEVYLSKMLGIDDNALLELSGDLPIFKGKSLALRGILTADDLKYMWFGLNIPQSSLPELRFKIKSLLASFSAPRHPSRIAQAQQMISPCFASLYEFIYKFNEKALEINDLLIDLQNLEAVNKLCNFVDLNKKIAELTILLETVNPKKVLNISGQDFFTRWDKVLDIFLDVEKRLLIEYLRVYLRQDNLLQLWQDFRKQNIHSLSALVTSSSEKTIFPLLLRGSSSLKKNIVSLLLREIRSVFLDALRDGLRDALGHG
ncbi:MAG: F-box protein [Anaerolineae bacterium]